MKKPLFCLLLAAGPLAAQIPPAGGGTNDGPAVTAVDGYAARVDSTIITYGEVRDSVMPFVQKLRQQFKGEELARQIQQAFVDARESLIEEALLKEEVKTLGLALPEQYVDEEADRLIRERFNGDRALLERALAARRMTFEEWKKEVADQLTLRVFYRQEVTQRAAVSEQVVRQEYERNKADYFRPFKVKYRLIVVSKESGGQDSALKKQQMEEALQKLRAGADFAALAGEISEGDTTESPWRGVSEVREELRPALLDLPAGGISDLIETPKEFFIVKVEERHEEGFAPFEEARATIEARLLAAERERLHRQLIARLAAKHFVERY